MVGCGALGSMQAELLVRMGVGALRLADGDTVAEMNLHRQIQFTEADAAAARNKAEAAAARLRTLNGACRIEAVPAFVTPATIGAFICGAGLILDATDSVPARYLINDAAVAAGIPWIYCGVSGTAGQILAVVPGSGPCLRCIFPQPPAPESVPSAIRGGILPVAVSALVSLQISAAIRLITGTLPTGRLIRFDVWEPALRIVRVERDPGCPCCSARKPTQMRS
jgi:adenylyltransferase/sulfurtransferase